MQTPGTPDDEVVLKGEKLKDLQTDSHFLEDELVQSWAPGRGIEDYAASATIEGRKPS